MKTIVSQVVLFLVVCFLSAGFASAAITFDSAEATFVASSSVSLNHTVSGSNTALVVEITTNSSSASVTYNGTGMELVNSMDRGDGQRITSEYLLINPSSGTHDILCTTRGSLILVAAASYDGVRQDGTIDGFKSVQNSSLDMTTTTPGDWIVYGGEVRGSLTGFTGMTERAEVGAEIFVADTNQGILPFQTHTASFTSVDNLGLWALNGIALAPVPEPSSLSLLVVSAFGFLRQRRR